MLNCDGAIGFHCPYCCTELKAEPTVLSCPGCRRTFEVIGGIPSFARNRDYYYGEISQAQMDRLISPVPGVGWEKAFRGVAAELKAPGYFIDYALKEGRAGWMYLLPIRTGTRVLDMGCGMGAISFALARRGCDVTSMDLTLERLRLLQARALGEGLTNIRTVRGGDTPYLPFPSASFDLVILNGVLEWVAQSQPDHVEDEQLRLLCDIARVLKADGSLYMGIENRWAWRYFRGEPEDHTLLPFLSLMPRALANLYARWKLGRPYTNYTYSQWGCFRLLRGAGFAKAKAYIPLPNYRTFSDVLDTSEPAGLQDSFRHGAKRHVPRWMRPFVVATLAPTFGIVARKLPDLKPSFLADLFKHLASQRGWQDSGSSGCRISKYKVTTTDTVVVRVDWTDMHQSWVVRLPLTNAATHACSRNEKSLKQLQSVVARLDSDFPEISQPLGSGDFRGIPYFVEMALPGVAGNEFARYQGTSGHWKRLALDFLARFHAAVVANEAVARERLEKLLADMVEPLASLLDRTGTAQLEQLARWVADALSGRSMPHLIAHGDFHSGNVLLDDSGKKLTGVIDWDRAGFHVASLNDIIHLLYDDYFYDRSLPATYAALAFARNDSKIPAANEFLEEYCRVLDLRLDKELRLAFGLLYWFDLLSTRLEIGSSRFRLNPQWIKREFLETLPQFHREAFPALAGSVTTSSVATDPVP